MAKFTVIHVGIWDGQLKVDLVEAGGRQGAVKVVEAERDYDWDGCIEFLVFDGHHQAFEV